MRLGLLVPEGTLTKELPIILQKYSYISIEVIFYSSVFHVPSLLQGKQKHLDCLLFFGKTTMEYTASKITPTIPWEVIPRTNATLLMVLLKASLMGDNIYKLATDLHINEKKMLHDSYQEANIDLSAVSVTYAPPFTFDETFVQHMKEFYYTCHQLDKDTTCITIYSDVYRQLKAEHFPIHYQICSLSNIYHGIEKAHSNFLLQISRESQLVIMYIVIDEANEYSPLASDEYQMTLEMLQVSKYIYIFAKKIQGAVLPITEREFLIFSTRTIIETQTDKFHHFSLIDDIHRHTASTISIGIGFGKTALEAKTHAKIGVKKAKKSGGNQIFLVYDKDTIRSSVTKKPTIPMSISDRFLSISSKTGISAFTLGQIHKIINEQGKTEFTASEMADLLNVSMRSINRTVLKLIDTGYCFEIGRKFQHKGGRPSRILRFKL